MPEKYDSGHGAAAPSLGAGNCARGSQRMCGDSDHSGGARRPARDSRQAAPAHTPIAQAAAARRPTPRPGSRSCRCRWRVARRRGGGAGWRLPPSPVVRAFIAAVTVAGRLSLPARAGQAGGRAAAGDGTAALRSESRQLGCGAWGGRRYNTGATPRSAPSYCGPTPLHERGHEGFCSGAARFLTGPG